jgi:hypothetical protein
MQFMIFSPPYDNNSGGSIVLHYLCHLLNEMGHHAAIVPLYKTYESDQRFLFGGLVRSFAARLRMMRKGFTVCPGLNTPVIDKPRHPLPGDVVAVYPEAVASNPLGAKNVVRWLLHRPGYHTGKVCYGVNELYFDYNAFSSDFGIPGSRLSKNKLFIAKHHDHLYNKQGALPPESRIGTAYCIRKGEGKKMVHDLDNSVLIDGLSHEQISVIFKRVKTFISYDTKTMYSLMAIACGAESVVVPDAGVSKEQWEPNAVRSFGIAYGMDDLENARRTVPDALKQLDEFSLSSKQAAFEFVNEVKDYFGL